MMLLVATKAELEEALRDLAEATRHYIRSRSYKARGLRVLAERRVEAALNRADHMVRAGFGHS